MGLQTCEGSIVGNRICAFSRWYGICTRGVCLEWQCNLASIQAEEVARVFLWDHHECEGGGFQGQRHGDHCEY